MTLPVTCAVVGEEALVIQCIEIAEAAGLRVAFVATEHPVVRNWVNDRGGIVVGVGEELAAALDEHPCDALLSISNLTMIHPDVLDRVSMAVNFHDGPLPDYAGLNVTSWALLAGETEHAVTWHEMTAGVDAGDVVVSSTFPIAPDETAFSLNARCYEAALATFPEVARRVAARDLATTPQPDRPRRECRRHDRPGRLFEPAIPAVDSARIVRSLDLGHRVWNGVGALRLVVDDSVVVVDRARVADRSSGLPPGTIVTGSDPDRDDGVTIATADGDIVFTAVSAPNGAPLELLTVLERHGLAAGGVLPVPDAALAASLVELEPVLARSERRMLDALVAVAPSVPSLLGRADGAYRSATVGLPEAADSAAVVAAVATWLSRTGDAEAVLFEVTTPSSRDMARRLAPLVRPPVMGVHVRTADAFRDLQDRIAVDLSRLRPLLTDAIGRDPRARGSSFALPVAVDLEVDDEATPVSDDAPGLRITTGAGELSVAGRVDSDDPDALDRIVAQIDALLNAGLRAGDTSPEDLPLLGPTDRALLTSINDTTLDFDRTTTLGSLFADQVARGADRPAVSFGDVTLTYAQLDAASAMLAGRLVAAGVRRGDRVGVATPRNIDMIVAVLATLRAGAAYLPLDPTYPPERLEFMVDDAGITALVASGVTAAQLARPGIAVVDPSEPPEPAVPALLEAPHPADLAYLIYTSGSTGRPKGVMLEHRHVVNFFVAMDDVISPEPRGVWLAVTSLSFDISVLELLWTLSRGWHVVLKADRGVPGHSGAAALPAVSPTRAVSFSLFYFSAGEAAAHEGYRLLLDSARFADQHGFEAVWTPERHFHAFGGAYPNPSVTSAALAAVTDHIQIRAGSVVLPLHSPVRVAEEWAVVDNISRGRVGISFAAGWQPNDFVLNPGAYANAKEQLPQAIEQVRRLWRGESVELPGHDGTAVSVATLPRPIQPELPVWLTSAGTPATFERAGTLGLNVLTHLLGQSIPQLADNVARYRAAWDAAGHLGAGRVTLMMHTYLDRDAATAREVAREPMKDYLSTAVGLLKDVASAFPTFAGRQGGDADAMFKSLSTDEMDQLLEVAAQRYLLTSGLFGSAADVAEAVETVSEVGVDEVACLIDFGIDTDVVLASLDALAEAKGLVDQRRIAATQDASTPGGDGGPDQESDTVAALVARHGVTHLQCTPSLAAMLVADPGDRRALGSIGHVMLGGEAMPVELARELRELLPGRLTNMYGPTETTIWSLVHEVEEIHGPSIPIGQPIANTTVHVLDRLGRQVPAGAFGELHIGGESVARGYHNRPELTAERFVDRPGLGRVYATGDVVRLHPGGFIEFAGRSDNQVKIRGHRIELGEIETVIDRHPGVVQSVVVARQDRDVTRLVAFVVAHRGASVDADELRKHVGEVLPDAMVPSVFTRVDAFPLTPNGKTDRKALETTELDLSAANPSLSASSSPPPVGDTEQLVADIWVAELDRPVGRDDNFFDIGGHSLLAVTVFRRLVDASGADLALTDIFRFPTVRMLAAHVSALLHGDGAAASPEGAAPTGTDRGALRRRALGRRGGGER